MARLPRIENEGNAPVDQPARDWRHRFGSKTEVENRHGEVAGIRPQHRFVQSMAEIGDHCARPDQRRLKIQGQQRIVFDDEHSDAAQFFVIFVD